MLGMLFITRSLISATTVSEAGAFFASWGGGGGEENTVALFRERTIPSERPPLVGEISANFLRIEGATWSA
jgi:hypothetical protein